MYTDLIIKIKNSQAAGKESLKVQYSKMDYAVASVLEAYGFIKKAEVKGKSTKKIIDIYCATEHPIQHVEFLSKPSIRRYAGYRDMKSVKSGHGIRIVSTPKGIMTSGDARREKVGGVLLCEIW